MLFVAEGFLAVGFLFFFSEEKIPVMGAVRCGEDYLCRKVDFRFGYEGTA